MGIGAVRRLFVFAALSVAASCVHRPPMTVLDVASSCHQVVPDRAQPVVWIAPNDARDLGRLGKWCQSVGPVLVDSPVRRGVSAGVNRLAIITWNVHVGGGDIEELIARLREGEFTEGTRVQDFVLLLQEAYREGDDVPAQLPADSAFPRPIVEQPPSGIRRDIRAVAEHVGLHVFYAPNMRNGTFKALEDRGTAILSTLPLAGLQVIELPFERQRRVALAATVTVTTTSGALLPLAVANVQMDTSLALTRGGPVAARRRQAEALLEALDGSAAGPEGARPMVLGGDFNTWFGNKESAVDVLRRAFPDTPRADNVTTWRGPLGTRAALDHVFTRGPVRSVATRRLPERFGSDHYPLSTILEF